MKEFLILMVLIWASNASHPVDCLAVKSQHQGLVATLYLLDGISQVNGNTAAGSLTAYDEGANEGLRGVKRCSRDVACTVEIKGSLEPGGEEENNIELSKITEVSKKSPSLEVIPEKVLQRSVRDTVDLLKPKFSEFTGVKENMEPPIQNNVQQCEVQSQRSVRDILHMPQTITNLSLLRGVLKCLTTITEEELEKDKKSKNLAIAHHTPQEVARKIIKHVELQDHLHRIDDIPEKNIEKGDELKRQARDVSHLLRTHSTQSAQPKDLKGEEGEHLESMRRDVTHVPEMQSTEAAQLESQLQEKVEQNQLADQLKRHTRESPQPKVLKRDDEGKLERMRRDVTHVPEMQSTEAPQLEGQLQVKVDQNHLAYQLKRQTRDVVHWLGTHNTQAPLKHDQTKEDVNKQERKIRDVSHLLETHITEASQSKDLLTVEEAQDQSADKLNCQAIELPQPKDHIREDEGKLERTRREVAHLLEIQSTEGPQSEGQFQVKVDQNQLADKLNRQARDVVPLLGIQTTQAPQFDDQRRDYVSKLERKIRDVSHLLETHTTEPPLYNDQLPAEEDQQQSADKLNRHARDVAPWLGIQTTQAPQLYDQEREDLDKLKRPTRDLMSHLLQTHPREVPLSEDLLKPEDQQAQIAGTLNRQTRDVAPLFGFYTTQGTNLDNPEREDVDKLKRPIRDVSHLLETYSTEAPQSKGLLKAEDQSADKVNRQLREAPLLGIHTTEAPQLYDREREDFDKGERTIRDASHLLGITISEAPQTTDVVKEYNVPDPFTGKLKRHVRQVVQLHGIDINEAPQTDEKLETGLPILPSNAEKDLRKDDVSVADSPKRPARDVSHFIGMHSTEIPQFQDQVKRDDTVLQDNSKKENFESQVRDVKHLFTSSSTADSKFKEILPIKDTVHPTKSDHQFEEVIGQLTRPTRDVKDLIESQTIEASQIEIVKALNADQVIKNLERQTRDVTHLFQSKDHFNIEKIDKKIDQGTLQNPETVNQQSKAKLHSGKRFSRDLIHLLKTQTTPNVSSKEKVKAEVSEFAAIASAERLKRDVEENPVASSLPENNIRDLLQRTQRSLEAATGSPPTFSDQIVEDDQYIESISKQQVAQEEDPPSFHQKTQRSDSIITHSESDEEIPNQTQEVLVPTPEMFAPADTMKRVTRSSLALEDIQDSSEELERLKRSSVVTVNDAGKIQRCDHLKSHAVHIADVPSKRVQRSTDVLPENPSAEVSTQISQSMETFTTPNPDSLVLLKPTVKVQPARLPLTVYAAKRNNVVKVTKRLPDTAFTEKPKANKRRF